MPAATKSWYVYILRCADDTLYAGITTDVVRRVREHNAGDARGARYTAGRLPVTPVYVEKTRGRSRAAAREAAIKKLERSDKLALCRGMNWELRFVQVFRNR